MSKSASESNLEDPRDKEELNAEEGNGLNEYELFRSKALESKQTQDDEITSLEEQDNAEYIAATPPQVFSNGTNGSDDASTGQEKDYEMKELEGAEGMQEQTEKNIVSQEASRESGPHSEEDNRVNPEKNDANSKDSTSNNDICNGTKSKSDENAELYQPPRKIQRRTQCLKKESRKSISSESKESNKQQEPCESVSKSVKELIQKIDLYCKRLGCHHVPTISEKVVITSTPIYQCRFCPVSFFLA